MEKLARLLQTKKLYVKPFITHRLKGKFEEVANAVEMMKIKPDRFIKPVVEIKW